MAYGLIVFAGSPSAMVYSASWQVIEERDSGVVRVQSVFSPVYVESTWSSATATRAGAGR